MPTSISRRSSTGWRRNWPYPAPGSDKVSQLREAQGLQDNLRELGTGTVALYTLVGEQKYRVLLITPNSLRAAEYAIPAAELNRKVLAFREVVADPRRDPRPLAQELYRILVGPIAKDLADAGAQTLMWSLDGVLRYLPIAALHDGQHYLVERYPNVLYTPASLPRLKDPPSARWSGLGLGVSRALAGFNPLPAVPLEMKAVIRDETAAAGTGGVVRGRVLLDDVFTKEAFITELRHGYPLVHIASHFQFQPGKETDSFLLLGNGDKMTLEQMRAATRLFSGVDLLTLSACNTATSGAGADGKEVEGFAVLAQRQGAKAVIATLWPVADVSTPLLMREFYRLREEEGMTKAEALQQAQAAMLRGKLKAEGAGIIARGVKFDGEAARFTADPAAPFAHPFFWAPFILIGNWK